MDKAQEVDISHVRVKNKRGLWPSLDSAPEVPLLHWLYPTEAVKFFAATIRKQAHIAGVAESVDYAVFANALIRSIIQPESDQLSTDYWQFPDETLYRMAGDCEDIAFLIGSILSCDENVRKKAFVALGNVSLNTQSYPHVRWTPLSRPKSGDPSLLFRQAVLAPTPYISAGVR